MIFHENCLLADDSHEISCLIVIFEKIGKIWNCCLLQIIGGVLWVKLCIIAKHILDLNNILFDKSQDMLWKYIVEVGSDIKLWGLLWSFLGNLYLQLFHMFNLMVALIQNLRLHRRNFLIHLHQVHHVTLQGSELFFYLHLVYQVLVKCFT